ncbi:TPA: hypothetical protein KIA74_004894 [Salmonella enterica]|nr:hypothetical protein [Salmonella enterica]
MTDSLLSSQDRALQLAKQELFIAKQTGDEKLKAQAWRDAETQGLKAGTQAFRDYYNVRLQTYQQQQANLKSAKDERNEQSAAVSAAKKAETQAERNARVLNEYRQKAELSADSTSELSREQAILAARQKLANPTQQQIAQVEKDAAAAWDKAAALKAQNAVPELKEKANYNAQRKALDSLKDQRDANGNLILSQQQYYKASEQLEKQHQANLAKIRSQQVTTPQQEAAGMVDPVQQLANQHAQQIALIQQFEQQGVIAHQNALALKNAADTEYEQQRIEAQWEIFRNQSQANELLASSLDGLQSGASSAITGLINGTQSLQESFANIGTTILNSVVGSLVQMGMEYVKSAVMAQSANATAATSAAATGASITASMAPAAAATNIATMGQASTIGMAAMASAIPAMVGLFGGARYNGGPVNANAMYRVGEHGKPEIFQASNGSQYMIPGDNGRVISNKDMQGGGSGGVVQHITFEINTTGGISDADWARIEANGVKISKKMALFHIHDEANRPGGIIQKRK